ncbi:aspartyl-tRNA(Asn)/glutamyl-tRNA (Gln) amidotransferase subunit B [Legionella beliardensis]|uniref:Aspartyl/glutamyl-tRNA(Asn/Gln) amidotransferase subunit B n=1 Tax=Legionella beliardensis TaxID=91822 RepID=A0A378I2S5_9GAMM|nr:Asp-tRNA(Asn)/Glu-tRNA(Gln) amidotransferase subunit GatB [Legionella beliardensis]STX29293.1 aspartyl-tRNA(Asn)/glutamyl-tRNA (Gln) amidotransferase subunit B [Legionella beliardensis]
MTWDTVIGLEVHAQLKTKSKLFSGASTTFGATPNSQTSLIDAGLPGVLPVLNKQAVLMAIQFGLAIKATINDLSYFERKNYFYPDLPKGYQISQFQKPIISDGQLTIEVGPEDYKTITIARAHLEEDAGKSLHELHQDFTGIDLNRAGTPLLEIVTTPCIYSAHEAISYLKTLHQLVRFLDICDGNMQEGSFRCDVNISIKPAGSDKLGVRTELKNLNSFRFIEKAIAFEQHRQQELLETGQPLLQETRAFCHITETTRALRSKENEFDYRYFPDPDLLPIAISAEEIKTVKSQLPPLPEEIKESLLVEAIYSTEDIQFLLSSPSTYHFFCAVKKHSQADGKTISNWLKTTYTAALNESNTTFENPPISAQLLGELLTLIKDKTISNAIAKQIFSKLLAGEHTIQDIIAREGYNQLSDQTHIEQLIKELTQQYPQQAEDYRSGKEKILAFFVGQIMKQTKGKANPEEVNKLLKQHLLGTP